MTQSLCNARVHPRGVRLVRALTALLLAGGGAAPPVRSVASPAAA